MSSKLISALLLTIACLPVFSQTNTGAKDTSFTTYSAYIKVKKTHPFISIATISASSDIKIKMNVRYASYGNRVLRADIFYPVNQKRKRPAVLLIHGGGWRSGNRSQNNEMARYLAKNGFVAVSAEYRLSTEALYPAAVTDLNEALSWMIEKSGKYKIDSGKIAVLGCSAGGQLAALLGSTSSKIKAVVDIDGIMAFIHPESGEGDDSKSTSAATYWFGAPKSTKPELWEQASALNHLSSTSPPFLFINSSVVRMHAGRDDAIKKLTSFSIYSEVHTFDDAPHPFWLFNPWFEPSMKFTVNFLNRALK